MGDEVFFFRYTVGTDKTEKRGHVEHPVGAKPFVSQLRKAIWEEEQKQFGAHNVLSASDLALWLLPDGKPQESRLLDEEEELCSVVFPNASKKKVVVTPVGAENWNVAFVVKGTPVPQGASEGHAKTLIMNMLLPQGLKLPQNKDDLREVLFPKQHGKIPVANEAYWIVAVKHAECAKEFLIETDGRSVLAGSMGSLLTYGPLAITSEMITSLYVECRFLTIFELLKDYAGLSGVKLSFNTCENSGFSYSQAIEPRKRPDTIGIGSGCTLLVGEDKRGDLLKAEADLASKLRPLKRMFYGDLKFILGYVAAGAEFQWMYVGRDATKELCKVGHPLDLETVEGRCLFLLSIGHACQLLVKMRDSLPDVPGRRALFDKTVSKDRTRTIFFYEDSVAKHIKDFWSYCKKQETKLDWIQEAYAAAKSCSFLPRAIEGPAVDSHDVYRVVFSPLGYECTLGSEEECRCMARCVCKALSIIHGKRMVHRDVRLPNIVRLSDKEFMLIDLESVVRSPFRRPKGFQDFKHWRSEMYNKLGKYTDLSDMYSLGKLLEEARERVSVAWTENGADFVAKLVAKQLTSALALEHSWLSMPME